MPNTQGANTDQPKITGNKVQSTNNTNEYNVNIKIIPHSKWAGSLRKIGKKITHTQNRNRWNK
jgi:hypothetical protein